MTQGGRRGKRESEYSLKKGTRYTTASDPDTGLFSLLSPPLPGALGVGGVSVHCSNWASTV